MKTKEVLARLRDLSNTERLLVIEEATRLIRAELTKNGESMEEDPILQVAGCLSGKPLSAKEIDQVLYGKE